MKSRSPLVLASILAVLACCPAVSATTLRSINIRGSVSVTASQSDEYNYLGQTRDRLDLNLVDAILNGSRLFDSGLRAGGQVYAYKIGDYSDVMIDWANLSYSFATAFGVRLGRNRAPLGLYNDSQDLDSVRTFASLPISFYPRTFRAITASVDGVVLFGSASLGKGGSLDYQAYGGAKESVPGDAPFVAGTGNLAHFEKWEISKGAFGGTLFWNLPVDGLRLGYSYMELPKNNLPGKLALRSEMRGWAVPVAGMVDRFMGPGTWDKSGLFAGTPSSTIDMRVQFRVISAEYQRGNWLFAAEHKLVDTTKGSAVTPAFALVRMPTQTPYVLYVEDYYGMVTYQATKRLGLGLYYCYENAERHNPAASSDPAKRTKDWAGAVSYAVNKWWIVKGELHRFDGRSFINGAGDDNRANGTAAKWNYLVIKTTFSF
jgi:hypothetical protein